jgi:hypothetical protein
VRKPTEIFFPVSATMNRLALANKGVEIHRWHSPAETQVRTRLPAGGTWIRTIGTSHREMGPSEPWRAFAEACRLPDRCSGAVAPSARAAQPRTRRLFRPVELPADYPLVAANYLAVR